MSYLVDGNNVMGQRVGWHRDKPGARRGLLEELARFASARRVSVSVVFDGKPEQHFADGSSYKGVKVFYAERGSNADERIKRMVDEARERRTLMVVTSDRELASYVRQCGVQVIRSGDFRKRLEETATDKSSSTDAELKVNQRDVSGWMRYFGVGPEDDRED